MINIRHKNTHILQISDCGIHILLFSLFWFDPLDKHNYDHRKENLLNILCFTLNFIIGNFIFTPIDIDRDTLSILDLHTPWFNACLFDYKRYKNAKLKKVNTIKFLYFRSFKKVYD